MNKNFTAKQVKQEIKKMGTPERAKASAWFFKTAPGQYGHGDIFVGLNMPDTRLVAKKFSGLPAPEVVKLLHSKIHEERMVALLIIVNKYSQANDQEKKYWFKIFWQERKWINNWDLVDVTVPKVAGEYFVTHPRQPLYALAKSKNIWERRIAVLSTFAFIKRGDFKDSLAIAKMLLNDTHDLIHKAVGWMLREIGKRSRPELEKFLLANYQKMPRTMLRYAIEHFSEPVRKKYLLGKI